MSALPSEASAMYPKVVGAPILHLDSISRPLPPQPTDADSNQLELVGSPFLPLQCSTLLTLIFHLGCASSRPLAWDAGDAIQQHKISRQRCPRSPNVLDVSQGRET
mmetsp:Transcript_30358/g.68618  ORF Transcript_30358/g.68618 Transcript_30358/m.68618 type:complete len:106 (-) Transcript_30358:7-324(-)